MHVYYIYIMPLKHIFHSKLFIQDIITNGLKDPFDHMIIVRINQFKYYIINK